MKSSITGCGRRMDAPDGDPVLRSESKRRSRSESQSGVRGSSVFCVTVLERVAGWVVLWMARWVKEGGEDAGEDASEEGGTRRQKYPPERFLFAI